MFPDGQHIVRQTCPAGILRSAASRTRCHACPGYHFITGRIQTEISLHALNRDGQEHGTMDKGQLDGMPVELLRRQNPFGGKNNRKDVS